MSSFSLCHVRETQPLSGVDGYVKEEEEFVPFVFVLSELAVWFCLDALPESWSSSVDFAGVRPSTSSANICRSSRCRLVSDLAPRSAVEEIVAKFKLRLPRDLDNEGHEKITLIASEDGLNASPLQDHLFTLLRSSRDTYIYLAIKGRHAYAAAQERGVHWDADFVIQVCTLPTEQFRTRDADTH